MKIIVVLIKLLVLNSIASCTFTSTNTTIKEESLSVSCNGLINVVNKNWKQHKKLKYYQSNSDFLVNLQKDYSSCLATFKKSDIVNLLGQPTEELGDLIYYDINKECKKTLRENCKMLVCQFRKGNGLLVSIGVQDEALQIHNNK